MPGFGPASAPVANCGVLEFFEASSSYRIDYIDLGWTLPLIQSRRTLARSLNVKPVGEFRQGAGIREFKKLFNAQRSSVAFNHGPEVHSGH